MKKRVEDYLKYIDTILADEDAHVDYLKLSREHLVQIGFFAHERQIHLIVTVTFAILTLISIFYAMSNPAIPLFLLVIALLILLVPYIKHYYLLENSVQKMYDQYDTMLSRYKKINGDIEGFVLDNSKMPL